VPFNTKQEAFDFIEEMKKDADSEFEGVWKDIGEGMSWVGGFFGWLASSLLWTIPKNILITPPKALFTAPNAMKDVGIWGPITWLFYILATVWSINYLETIYRRIAKDTAARFVWEGKWPLSTLRIPDYGKSDKTYFSNNETEAKLRNEYLQRIEAIEKLKVHGRWLTGAHKQRFEKELKKVQSYLNVNTDTFWLKAESLRKDHGKFMRWFRNI